MISQPIEFTAYYNNSVFEIDPSNLTPESFDLTLMVLPAYVPVNAVLKPAAFVTTTPIGVSSIPLDQNQVNPHQLF